MLCIYPCVCTIHDHVFQSTRRIIRSERRRYLSRVVSIWAKNSRSGNGKLSNELATFREETTPKIGKLASQNFPINGNADVGALLLPADNPRHITFESRPIIHDIINPRYLDNFYNSIDTNSFLISKFGKNISPASIYIN